MSARVHRWLPFAVIAAVAAVGLVIAAEQAGWRYLFLTPDHRGRLLLEHGEPQAAAEMFRNPLWRGVAAFRAGDFKAAAQAFGVIDDAEGAYDQATALVMLGQYDEALKRYDRALALRPGWPDAVANREIARIRGIRKKAEGGMQDDADMEGDEGPDQVVFDKTKKGGVDTTVQGAGKPMTDETIRALWLRRVQTKPADFLRVRFNYQLQAGETGTKP